MAIRVFVGIIGGTAFVMFEGTVMAILREQKADYSLQRVYASIGGMISSSLSGILMDYASKGKGYTDLRLHIDFKFSLCTEYCILSFW
jgi:H+/Cl- antiporter ClcA